MRFVRGMAFELQKEEWMLNRTPWIDSWRMENAAISGGSRPGAKVGGGGFFEMLKQN